MGSEGKYGCHRWDRIKRGGLWKWDDSDAETWGRDAMGRCGVMRWDEMRIAWDGMEWGARGGGL